MKKFTNALLLSILMLLLAVSPAMAHSGRTDASGGHRDNKNASGLGYYHYHCGGYPAHLHPNGVCPYTGAGSSSGGSSYTPVSTPAPTPKPTPKPQIVATQIRTFIKGYEVPTFAYTGIPSSAVIIAEDLKDYGYDVDWDGNANSLVITRNDEKEITPIPMDYYRGFYPGQHMFDIYPSNIRVTLQFGGQSYTPGLVYSLGGYMAVSVDELKCLGQFEWHGDTQTVTID